jgi:hypothetical protein
MFDKKQLESYLSNEFRTRNNNNKNDQGVKILLDRIFLNIPTLLRSLYFNQKLYKTSGKTQYPYLTKIAFDDWGIFTGFRMMRNISQKIRKTSLTNKINLQTAYDISHLALGFVWLKERSIILNILGTLFYNKRISNILVEIAEKLPFSDVKTELLYFALLVDRSIVSRSVQIYRSFITDLESHQDQSGSIRSGSDQDLIKDFPKIIQHHSALAYLLFSVL